MAYNLMKRIIDKAIRKGTIEEERPGIMDKLDAFLAADRLTVAQYEELVALANGNEG